MMPGRVQRPEVYISHFIGSRAKEILKQLPGAFGSQFYLSFFLFSCLPLNIVTGDGSPVRAVAQINEL
jgi:kynurenine formamidase